MEFVVGCRGWGDGGLIIKVGEGNSKENIYPSTKNRC